MKKIVLLDLGGVVFQSTGNSNKIINWKEISKLNNKYGYDLNIGEDKFPNFLNDYNHITNQQLSREQFLQAVFNTLRINNELIDFLRKERDIIIVSDNYRENINYISKRYNFEKWAIKEIYSFDYKMVKSNPDFFERLIQELTEFEQNDLIFIDDSQHKVKQELAKLFSS